MKIKISDGLRDEIANFTSAFAAKIKSLRITQQTIDKASELRAEAFEKARSIEQSESVPSDKEVTVLVIARTRLELLVTRLQKLGAQLKPERDAVLDGSHQAGELFRVATAQPLEENIRARFIESLPTSLRTNGWQNAWSGSAERRALGTFLHSPAANRNDEISEILSDAEGRLARLHALLAGDDIVVPAVALATKS